MSIRGPHYPPSPTHFTMLKRSCQKCFMWRKLQLGNIDVCYCLESSFKGYHKISTTLAQDTETPTVFVLLSESRPRPPYENAWIRVLFHTIHNSTYASRLRTVMPFLVHNVISVIGNYGIVSTMIILLRILSCDAYNCVHFAFYLTLVHW